MAAPLNDASDQNEHQVALARGLTIDARASVTFASTRRHAPQFDLERQNIARHHLTAKPRTVEPTEEWKSPRLLG